MATPMYCEEHASQAWDHPCPLCMKERLRVCVEALREIANPHSAHKANEMRGIADVALKRTGLGKP